MTESPSGEPCRARACRAKGEAETTENGEGGSGDAGDWKGENALVLAPAAACGVAGVPGAAPGSACEVLVNRHNVGVMLYPFYCNIPNHTP